MATTASMVGDIQQFPLRFPSRQILRFLTTEFKAYQEDRADEWVDPT